MQRIMLMLVTNFAVMIMFSITWAILDSVFDISGMLAASGMPTQYGYYGVMALVFGFGGSFISLWMSKGSAIRGMGVQIIETPSDQTEQWLHDMVRRQSERAGIGMPDVGIFHSASPNAFATGANKNSALVAVSDSLINQMTADEVEAVVGHEIAHVANGDMVTQTLLQGILNTFVIFLSRIIANVISRRDSGGGGGMAYYACVIVLDMVFGFIASFIVMWFSRRREYFADKGGAELAGREKMIAALQRLQAVSEPQSLPAEMAAFGIAGGLKAGLGKLLSTHPPLDDRIRALQERRYD